MVAGPKPIDRTIGGPPFRRRRRSALRVALLPAAALELQPSVQAPTVSVTLVGDDHALIVPYW
jgi:hypothetical protein